MKGKRGADSSDDDGDDVPEAEEYRLMEDEDLGDEKEVLVAAASNKKGNEKKISAADQKAQEVLDKYRMSRWFDQPSFADVGVTLSDLQREDALQQGAAHDDSSDDADDRGGDSSSEECDPDGIRDVSDSELPQMPKTEKQKRKV